MDNFLGNIWTSCIVKSFYPSIKGIFVAVTQKHGEIIHHALDIVQLPSLPVLSKAAKNLVEKVPQI